MTLLQNQFQFTTHVGLLLQKFELLGYQVSLGEVYRTAEQQHIYFQQGLSKTNNSMHLKRLAIDLNIFKDGKLVKNPKELLFIGQWWNGLDNINRCGIIWGWDIGHFERQVF